MSDSAKGGEKSGHGSMWADCAECESGNTTIKHDAFEDDPIICGDCGAETEGINKVGDL